MVPGVRMTAIATNATPPNAGTEMRFEVLGHPGVGQQTALLNLVGPEFFSTLRIPRLKGRIWSETETHNGATLAVINETWLRLYFPNGDPVGHSLKSDIENPSADLTSAPGIAGSWLQIVGVVGDSRDAGLSNPVKPAISVPWTLQMPPSTQILVRAEGAAVRAPERNQARTRHGKSRSAGRACGLRSRQMDQRSTGAAAGTPGCLALLAFAVLALSLSAVGLYSVVSYTVTQRTSEFGIRVALGAQRGHVLQIVFASTVVSVGSGVLIGVVLTLALILSGTMGRRQSARPDTVADGSSAAVSGRCDCLPFAGVTGRTCRSHDSSAL